MKVTAWVLGLVAVSLTGLTSVHVHANENLVPNPSLELSANGTAPDDWATGYLWGDLDAEYVYPAVGYSSNRAAHIQITRYESGDAKWYFNSQTVQPNTAYTFSDYYQSDSTTYVVVMYERGGGNISYSEIGTALPSANWQAFTATFTTPEDVVRLSVFHVIATVGYLTTDNFSLRSTAVANTFERGLISVTFDDGWQSAYTSGLPILDQFGIKSTQYMVTGFINTPGYMTANQVRDFHDRGHQIASHTVNHYDLTALSRKKLINELSRSKTYLEQIIGAPVVDMAAPYGAYNTYTLGFVDNYYLSHRTSDVGFNSKQNFNRYVIRSQYITPQTSLSEFQQWVNTARTQKVWLVLMYHQVDNSGSAYSVTPEALTAHLQVILNSGLETPTVRQAIEVITPQL